MAVCIYCRNPEGSRSAIEGAGASAMVRTSGGKRFLCVKATGVSAAGTLVELQGKMAVNHCPMCGRLLASHSPVQSGGAGKAAMRGRGEACG